MKKAMRLTLMVLWGCLIFDRFSLILILCVPSLSRKWWVEFPPLYAASVPSLLRKRGALQVRLMHDAGYEFGNLDGTIILQRPKLSFHKETIKANLSHLLGAEPFVVILKAKTHERVDCLGESEYCCSYSGSCDEKLITRLLYLFFVML